MIEAIIIIMITLLTKKEGVDNTAFTLRIDANFAYRNIMNFTYLFFLTVDCFYARLAKILLTIILLNVILLLILLVILFLILDYFSNLYLEFDW